jgi:cytochrome c-type biogenesis protein
MDLTNVGLGAALLAGLISFFSPCVLPLVPVFLGLMTGQVTVSSGSTRFRAVAHAAFFVLGFGLVFVLLGATAGLLGRLVQPIMPYIVKVGGALLILFGLHLTGLVPIPFLYMDKHVDLRQQERKNFWSSFLVGIVFAAGWTPCVGPVLAAILLLAADSQTLATGATLLAAYALGLGFPFLGAAALIDVLGPVIRKSGRIMHIISVVGGALLILMGLLLITGFYDGLVFWLNSRLA